MNNRGNARAARWLPPILTKVETMYEAHFQLAKRPFLEFPDRSCFFVHEPVPEIIRELVVQLENGQGIVVLTGPHGIGKTLICRKIAAELGRHRSTVRGGSRCRS